MDLKELKEKLKTYKKEDLEFNEPHFTNQLAARLGSKEELISNLLNPDKLVYAYKEENKPIYCLYFKISNKRTLKIPVIFDKGNKKSLYILTYIMRHRSWQRMRFDKK